MVKCLDKTFEDETKADEGLGWNRLKHRVAARSNIAAAA